MIKVIYGEVTLKENVWEELREFLEFCIEENDQISDFVNGHDMSLVEGETLHHVLLLAMKEMH